MMGIDPLYWMMMLPALKIPSVNTPVIETMPEYKNASPARPAWNIPTMRIHFASHAERLCSPSGIG